MRVVVAPDSFKGTLDAVDAASALARGWISRRPGDVVDTVPLADGGEGTVAAFARASPEAIVLRTGRSIEWVWLPDGRGVVELASACGITVVGTGDPLGAHTGGLGEVLGSALDAGVTGLIVGLGGSASTDGGTGALTALGARFLDVSGVPLPPGGAALARLDRVDTSSMRPPPAGGVELLADVDNPLLGPGGAAAVFGPQKGAAPDDVAALERGLQRLHDVFGTSDTSGYGAAGGTAYGLAALWGARVVPGARAVLEAVGATDRFAAADLVITGEGRFDPTSLGGKLVGTVLSACGSAGVPVAVVAGAVDPAAVERSAVRHAVSLVDLAGSTDAALATPVVWLEAAGAALADAVT